MWRIVRTPAAAAAMLISAQAASADALLYGAVEFDPTTDLYTYSYAVENDTSSTIFQVNVLVGNVALGTYSNGQFLQLPPSYTSPSGWSLRTGYSGSIAYPPGAAGRRLDENPISPRSSLTHEALFCARGLLARSAHRG